MTDYCNECGYIIPEDSKFCPNCGNPIEEKKDSKILPSTKINIWLTINIIILILGLIFSSLYATYSFELAIINIIFVFFAGLINVYFIKKEEYLLTAIESWIIGILFMLFNSFNFYSMLVIIFGVIIFLLNTKKVNSKKRISLIILYVLIPILLIVFMFANNGVIG